MLKVIKESHVDHGLTEAQIDWLLAHFAEKTGFFIETVTLPENLGTVPCGLYGPLMGDLPVTEAEVSYVTRGERKHASRLVKRPTRPCRQVTVIAGPDGDLPLVLYTAFSGPVTPKEPGDATLKPEEREASVKCWAEHALVG